MGEGRAILLDGSGQGLWRRAPFSAVRTDCAVEACGGSFFANCGWDALGICAALLADGIVHASCGCCRLPMDLRVRGGRLEPAEGLVHIAVPAKDWYQDVVFT